MACALLLYLFTTLTRRVLFSGWDSFSRDGEKGGRNTRILLQDMKGRPRGLEKQFFTATSSFFDMAWRNVDKPDGLNLFVYRLLSVSIFLVETSLSVLFSLVFCCSSFLCISPL
ncbi:hypothetical protein BGZ61DRAFT_68789 [Ilyonectria robusta]|uniref:uncharacterized protein n=1 Tax=Ilyonectria robusta TaxID=1079257 RepID=UPI001E8E7E42|nr:uncharacterized protein BGZ61DRAFT_68789 [Ilyonectria robusta]KAH8679181.1 hypothetical protein BGZ61DRAFT_68789 [Ilyonectria robusta]